MSPNDGTEWRQRTQSEAEHFVDVSAMTSDVIAKMINEDNIQILINLNGYTKVYFIWSLLLAIFIFLMRFIVVEYVDTVNVAKINAQATSTVTCLINFNGTWIMQGARNEIFAMQPAPIQVSYMGFPGTTGANYIDYLVTDEVWIEPLLS